MNTSNNQHPELIHALMQPDCYDHPVRDIQLIETHISWIILTGDYAYKIKKPCNLGFLDFSTLEKRKIFCHEELRLNKRLAAPIYLAVVPITGTISKPVLHGTGNIIEYAVKMVQFPQHVQLDTMLATGHLTPQHMDAIAQYVAEFHQNTAFAAPNSSFGTPEHIFGPVAKTFTKIQEHVDTNQYHQPLNKLINWCESTFEALKPVFEQRKKNGFIRECHGDMHLCNLIWWQNTPIAFDCLEFDPDLRWIDTLSEVAFVVMDLHDRNAPQLAQRFLNTYLEHCGDYAGIPVFRFYLVYRAIVRAMVNAIRARQKDITVPEKDDAEKAFQTYLDLALSYIHHEKPLLIITHGLSASGKSTLSQPLLEHLGAIRIRSDVERKRMFGLFPPNKPAEKLDTNPNIYSIGANIKTYTKLKTLTETILEADFSVIVDAAFLKYEERQSFLLLARDRQLPFIILTFSASADTLRQRIQARKKDVSDADLAVLEFQLTVATPLQDDELPYQIIVDTEIPVNAEQLVLSISQKRNNSILSMPIL